LLDASILLVHGTFGSTAVLSLLQLIALELFHQLRVIALGSFLLRLEAVFILQLELIEVSLNLMVFFFKATQLHGEIVDLFVFLLNGILIGRKLASMLIR
jgi:hypothetical protein